MTRRLVIAILGTAIAALLLAGLGTFLLAAATARRTTERALLAQATDLAKNYAKVESDLANRPAVDDTVQRIFRVDGLAFLREDGPGKLVGTPPKGVSPTLLNPAALLGGKRISGRVGKMVWVAAPATSPEGRTVVAVLVRKVANGFAPAWRWFLMSSGIVIVLGALVAVSLSRRLTQPIREADQAAKRIAAGELSTRLTEPSQHKKDELAELVRSVNTMASSLERSKGVEQQFLLSISHDLRTPLTSIRGYAEAISDGATTDPSWAAGVILKESRRLERLVGDLLELAKLQSRSFSFHMQSVDLAAVALDTREAFGAEATEVGLHLVVDAPEHIVVTADRDRLGQVAANLVENAKNYAKTSITVGARVVDGTPMLWVDDDGPGIAPGDRPHVFERLYRSGQQPIRAESSSGLGLAIVAELTMAMDATITAEQAPNGGARMVVRFAHLAT
jgi:two-component system, OmpR family, sensor kinase